MANLIDFTSRTHVNDSTFCAYLQEKRFVSGKALIMRLATALYGLPETISVSLFGIYEMVARFIFGTQNLPNVTSSVSSGLHVISGYLLKAVEASWK